MRTLILPPCACLTLFVTACGTTPDPFPPPCAPVTRIVEREILIPPSLNEPPRACDVPEADTAGDLVAALVACQERSGDLAGQVRGLQGLIRGE